MIKGKIYSIRSYQTDQIYIGSTIEKLSQRMAKHRCGYKNFLNNKKHYITSFELLKYNDCYIELIENYECDDKQELRKREGEHIRNTENCVNKFIAGREHKKWLEENKESIKEYKKQYAKNNKDNIKEYKKQYAKDNEEQLKKYRKEYYKQYNENKKFIKQLMNISIY